MTPIRRATRYGTTHGIKRMYKHRIPNRIVDLKLIRVNESRYINPAHITHLIQDEQGQLEIHVAGIPGVAATIRREAASGFLDKLGGFRSPYDDMYDMHQPEFSAPPDVPPHSLF